VLFWFVGGGLVAVWNVFHDPTFDHRLLVAGLLLPDVIDGLLGGARILHSIAASVALLVIVVVATIGRRAVRRRLLAVPIGTFLHLVLDGAFNNTRVFWWPFSGLSLPSDRLPSVDRSLGLNLILEVLGVGALIWAWNRFGLASARNRRELWRTGALPGTRDGRGVTC
jgi:membrane-bound metal-dependent hydrolase YbcI (DUF457 family)